MGGDIAVRNAVHAPPSASFRFVVAGVVAAVIGSVWTLITADTIPVVVGFGVGLAFVECAALLARSRGFTATVIPVLVVNAVMLSGLIWWPVVAPYAIVSARLGVDMDALVNAALYGMAFTASFTAGTLLVGMGGAKALNLSKFADIHIPTGALVAASYVVLALTFAGYGSALLRGDYLGSTGPEAVVIAANALAPVALISVCFAVFRPGGVVRVLAALGIVLWTLILFGRASRTLAALPVFLLLGWKLSTKKPVRWWHIALVAIATVFLLQLPLALRSNENGVGLLNLSEAFISDPGAVMARFDPAGVAGNLLFSAPLAGLVGSIPLAPETLWISITPVGGETAGWTALSPYLKVNASTPYNTIGELAAHGWTALALVPLLIGAVFALAERIASNLPGLLASAGLLMVVAVAALYSVQILQYNLRSSTRLVWYLLAGVAVVWLVSVLFRRQRATRREARFALRTDASVSRFRRPSASHLTRAT